MMEPIIKVCMAELNTQMEGDVLKVCHSYGIEVDKERLMQALTDARAFYDEGYRDGRSDAEASWISVKDRLPEEEAFVLCSLTGRRKNVTYEGAPVIGTYYADEGWVLEEAPGWENPPVTHWMPLPEPPKEV